MKYFNKTIEYGLYLLVFLLPMQTRWIIKAGFNEYQTYSLYGTDILLILILLLLIIHKFLISNFQFSNNFQLPNFQTSSKSWWFIGGLLLTSAVSVFSSLDKFLALYKLGWLILGIGLFRLIVSVNYGRLKFIYALLGGLFFQAVLGIWQFLTQSSFANKWFGLALHQAVDLGTSVVETVGADGAGERWLRAYGGLDHPNMFGGMMAIGALLLVGEIIKTDKIPNPDNQFPIKSQIPITNFQTDNKFQITFRIINWLFLPVFSAALFFSFSRAAWLAAGAGLAAMLAGAVIKRDRLAQKNILQTILISGAVIFILFLQYPNLVMARLYGGERLEIKSTNERIESIKNSWPVIKNNFASGAGLGNYTYALSRQTPNRESFYYQPAHDVFLLVWAETGIAGLLFFIGLLFAVAGSVLFLPSPGGRRRDPGVGESEEKIKPDSLCGDGKRDCVSRNGKMAVILIALVIIMIFDHWLFSLHFGVLFFWLVIGLVIRNS